MHIYRMDEVDEGLELLPMAARRALDIIGQRLSLAAWQGMPVPLRQRLTELGSALTVQIAPALECIKNAEPQATEQAPTQDPPHEAPPPAVLSAFEKIGEIPGATWSALSHLDRYALAKVAVKGRPNRLRAAYDEIIGQSALSTHLSPDGGVRMVDVGAKVETHRVAIATSVVQLNADAYGRLKANNPKGDVLATARIAGIMAAKKTSELIPLCHPIALTKAKVELRADDALKQVQIEAIAECHGRTGVEMEALTAASCAALTVYDMLKAFDRGIEIGPTRLRKKTGGRSGDYEA